MKKKLFIKNAAILTVTSLALRFIGIFFKVWLAGKVGAEGIGLYQLVFSFYALVSTFAVCGISTAVTRLITDELVLGNRSTISKIITRAVMLSLAIAAFSMLTVYFGAEIISDKIIGDIRAKYALKILSFSLPFMGVSSCLKGYFISRRNTSPPALSQILEQIVRIVMIYLFLYGYSGNVAEAASAVMAGDTVAEAVSCGFVFICYKIDIRKTDTLTGRSNLPYLVSRKISHIALPIAGGRYLNSALRTAENILVPKALNKAALSPSQALGVFGNIKGMALPILLFPSSLLSSVAMMLIPEIGEYSAKGNHKGIRKTTSDMFYLTFTFSIIIAVVFYFYGENLGEIIYSDRSVGKIIMQLSPLVPVMYIDSVADGILKGLDEQLATFRHSIIDSVLRLILVMLILPKYSVMGFIFIMYISNFLTAALNLMRLRQVTKFKINFLSSIITPSLFAAVAAFVGHFLALPVRNAGILCETATFILAAVGVYGILIILKDFRGKIPSRS